MAKKNPPRFDWRTDNDGIAVCTDKRTGEKLRLDCADLHESVSGRVHAFGASSICQTRTSQVAASNKMDAMNEYWNLLCSGEWQKPREGGGFRQVSAIVCAIAEALSCSEAKAQERWNATSKEAQEALREKFAERVDEILKERRTAEEPESLDELLD